MLLVEYGQRYADRITLTDAPEKVIKQLQQLYAKRGRLIKVRRGEPKTAAPEPLTRWWIPSCWPPPGQKL